MKAATSKRKDYQSTSLFLSAKELGEIKNALDEIIAGEKEVISFKSSEYDMVLTKAKEGAFTITFDCKLKE